MGKKSKLPDAPTGSLLYLSPDTYAKIQKAVDNEVVLDPTQFEKIERKGSTYYRYRGGDRNSDRSPLRNGCFYPYLVGEELHLTPGRIVYHKVLTHVSGDAGTDSSPPKPPAVFLNPVSPTVSGAAIEEDGAFFGISGRSGATLWLECISDPDNEESTDPESDKILIADRGDRPSGVAGRTYVRLADLDFEDDGSGAKAITNLKIRWGSDWVQDYGSPTQGSDSFSGDESDSGTGGDSSGSGGGGPSGGSDDSHSDHQSSEQDSQVVNCCQPIAVYCNFISPDCFPSDDSRKSLLLEVSAQIGDGTILCPGCHDIAEVFLIVNGGGIGGGTQNGGGVPTGGLVNFSRMLISPVKPCAWMPIEIVVSLQKKSGANPGCRAVTCNQKVYVRVPSYCGHSCSSSSGSGSGSHS